MTTFNDRLKKLRLEKGLTQKQLSTETNLSERGVQNYESGERKPTFEIFLSLAEYFQMSLDYLAGLSDNPKRR